MLKNFLKHIFFVALLICTITSFAQRTSKKMNVVFFLVDDLGWKDLACYGSEFYETPNIDRLAKEGVKFTDAYSSCHVCSPSRASILNGKYPARTGLSDWLPGRKDFPFQKFLNVRSVQQLAYEDSTLAETLRANGYNTAIFGKWHLGEDPSNPLAHGFNERLSDWNKGWPAKSYFSPYAMPGLTDGPDGEYLTDRVTTEALKYMEKNKDRPFFVYLSQFAVHDPIQGRPDLVEKYRKKLKQMTTQQGAPFILEGNPDAKKPLTRAELNELLKDDKYAGYNVLPQQTVKIKQYQDNVQFAAMVDNMDENLGRVMAKLKELGIDENTIIVFVSDNGGMSAANVGNPYRVIRENGLNGAFASSNLPLRAGKGWLYEGGIRVPMIIKWPGQAKAGLQSKVPVISTDFYPTILDMLGLPLMPQQHMDGVSIKPVLQGQEKLNRKAVFWHFPHYSNHGMQSPGGAVRAGNYKLIEYFENNTVQLFNLANDIGEQNDLSKKEPGKVKELRAMLHQWRKSVGAKMLVPNPDFSPDSTAGPRNIPQNSGIGKEIGYRFLPVESAAGLLGERVQMWRDKRLWYVAEAPFLLSGFEKRPGEHIWQGEHAGKWLHAATLTYSVTKDKKLESMLRQVANRLVAAQLPNGYIGTYDESRCFYKFTNDTKGWDIWTQRYNLYGLLTYEKYNPDDKVVNACKKMADLLMDIYGNGKTPITHYGTRYGMSTTTLLESIVMLYERTKEKKYLDFAEYIVMASDAQPGLRLMGSLLANESVVYPGDGKAYQLMSNLLGYFLLYKHTGNDKYLKTVMNGWNQVRNKHVLITGGPWTRKMAYNANKECFAHDDAFNPFELVVENCCTVTWLQLNLMLFEHTGKAVYFTEAEKAFYNQLLGGQLNDGVDWCYYTKPNEAVPPFETTIHCCASSGPRALEMFYQYLAGITDNAVSVNVLSPMQVALTPQLGGGHIAIKGNYPLSSTASMVVNVNNTTSFAIEFRIPENSSLKSVDINGETVQASLNNRGFYSLKKRWQKGDIISVKLNYELKMAIQQGEKGSRWAAFSYGPLALAQKISATPADEPLIDWKPDMSDINKIIQKSGSAELSFTLNNSTITLAPYYEAGSRTTGPRTYFKIAENATASVLQNKN